MEKSKNYSVLLRKESGSLTPQEIRQLIGRDNPTILEIGANIGQTTIEFLKAMPHAKIYCFEPDPRAITQFKRNINNPNVCLVESAIGSINGKTQFHQSNGDDNFKDWNQSGSIRKPKTHTEEWPWVKFDSVIEVPILRLDDWMMLQGLSTIDFIWADTQGAEIDLIKGAINTLKITRFFYTEYSDVEWYEGQVTLQEIDDLLDDFHLVRVFKMDALFENTRLTIASTMEVEKRHIENKDYSKMKLHIGGEQVKESWKILNIQPKEGVDFIGDISDLSQFSDASIDEIYASHTLEHVTQKKMAETLSGIFRVLKLGGKFYISVPDLDILCHTFISPLAPMEVKFQMMRMMFGGQEDSFDFHYFGWNQALLYQYLHSAGFSDAERVDSFNLFNDFSNYQPFGFPISLNVIAKK